MPYFASGHGGRDGDYPSFVIREHGGGCGAIAARAANIPPPTLLTAKPSPLDKLTGEIQWAHAELMIAWEANDFRAWVVDFDDEKPHRFRLARALVTSRELDLSDQLVATINRELEKLWGALTLPEPPSRFGFRRCDPV